MYTDPEGQNTMTFPKNTTYQKKQYVNKHKNISENTMFHKTLHCTKHNSSLHAKNFHRLPTVRIICELLEACLVVLRM